MLLRHRPSGLLARCVDSLWYSERGALPHTRERSLPTGCADIVVPLLQDHLIRYDPEPAVSHARWLRGAVVQGASDRFGVRGTEGPSAVIGVHFKPGGAAAFFGGALPELRNRTELLEDLWGLAARDLREQLQDAGSARRALQLLQGYLLQRLHDAAPPDPLVSAAIVAFHRDPARARVEPVQQGSGCTPAQFIRRFEQAVGLTPKRYARVLRFGVLLPSLVRCGPRDWAQIAAGAGYYDQSHLIREFRELAGIAPGAYVPVQADQPTHVAVER
ncbi:helix-turn-helix domain-containing protein [Ramlibacter solisilvae]|uniref:AraC family transcriptional regulator n=1 Tax=Ramlibacter tataouinensis TaxID=94132 RepID=UPI000776BC9F|nr:helix-turn-helix domain-containing protein [Ramlibacter tataouinensis]